jgi:hypothetical protein
VRRITGYWFDKDPQISILRELAHIAVSDIVKSEWAVWVRKFRGRPLRHLGDVESSTKNATRKL